MITREDLVKKLIPTFLPGECDYTPYGSEGQFIASLCLYLLSGEDKPDRFFTEEFHAIERDNVTTNPAPFFLDECIFHTVPKKEFLDAMAKEPKEEDKVRVFCQLFDEKIRLSAKDDQNPNLRFHDIYWNSYIMDINRYNQNELKLLCNHITQLINANEKRPISYEIFEKLCKSQNIESNREPVKQKKIESRQDINTLLKNLVELSEIYENISIEIIRYQGDETVIYTAPKMEAAFNNSKNPIGCNPKTGLPFDKVKFKQLYSDKILNYGSLVYKENKFVVVDELPIKNNPIIYYCGHLNQILAKKVLPDNQRSILFELISLCVLYHTLAVSSVIDPDSITPKQNDEAAALINARIDLAIHAPNLLLESKEEFIKKLDPLIANLKDKYKEPVHKPILNTKKTDIQSKSAESIISQLQTIWKEYDEHLKKDMPKNLQNSYNDFDKITISKHAEVQKLLGMLEPSAEKTPKQVLAEFKKQLELSHDVFSQSRDPWYLEVVKQLITLGFINLYRHVNKGNITRGDQFFHTSISKIDENNQAQDNDLAP